MKCIDVMTQTYVFDNIFDVYYSLFNEIGIGVNNNGYLYDQENGNFIQLDGKYIKASINGSPIYPSRNDIVFEPDKNYKLIKSLFMFYIDKCVNNEDENLFGQYIADFIEDNEDKTKQRIVLRSGDRGDICSKFYNNIYLSYIDCIFTIAGFNVILDNFDIILEK